MPEPKCGIYGKLPARRDFVSRNVPSVFLNIWEPWIHGGMTASQLKYSSDEWQTVFDRAPFWRFWLGANLCGRTVVGGFAPSRDGIDRAFPLTVFAIAEEAEFFPPPVINMQSKWFQLVGEFIDNSRTETDWEGTLASQLNALPMPTTIRPDSGMSAKTMSDGSFRISTDQGSMAELLQGIGTLDSQSTYAQRSICGPLRRKTKGASSVGGSASGSAFVWWFLDRKLHGGCFTARRF